MAVERQDLATVRGIAAANPERVVVDDARHGVHVLACNGSVFAFFPLAGVSSADD